MHNKRIPLKDFFRNPERANYQLSPDGSFISWLAPLQTDTGTNRMNIVVQNRRDGSARVVTNETARDIAGYTWKNSNRILYVKDFSGDENYHIVSVDAETSEAIDITPFEGVRAEIIDIFKHQEVWDNFILVGLNKRNPEIFDVYLLNIQTGEISLVAENPGSITQWITDHNGMVRCAVETNGVESTLLYRDTEQEEFRPVLTTNFKDTVAPLFFTFDNKYLYVASNLHRDKTAIVVFDIAAGEEYQMIYEHPEVDVSQLSYSRKRKLLTAITFTTWKRERVFLDSQSERIFERIASRLAGYEVVIVDMNKEENLMVVRSFSDRSLGSYYLYDLLKDTLTKLSDVSPWLNEKDLCEMKPIHYTSRDGKRIHGYLTMPKTQVKTNLPVVVHPHGGPWARDSWGYNPEIQFLANRGYAVFQMNFRGSTGYGRAFWEASFKQWGQSMQDDISDGVEWLKSKAIADPRRIAIYGGSYGGYAVLAGLTFTPDLYACGIDCVGVSNLFTFMKTIPPYWKPFLEMMYEMVGNPEHDEDLFRRCSPVFHVESITSPLFVAQGAKDPRVNISESDQIVEALKSRGIDVLYLVKEDEGHGFRNEENRFDFYEKMEQFLAKHIGTD